MSAGGEIVEVLTRLFVGTDERDWPAVERCFAPTVLFDMSSAGGGPPSQKTPDEIASAWEAGLKPIRSVHHQVGNFLVDVAGDHATATCHGVAYHHLPRADGRSTRTFVGTYAFELERSDAAWRISAFRFNLKFIDGNVDLERPETASKG